VFLIPSRIAFLFLKTYCDVFKSDFAELTQTQIDDLVKNIEFYQQAGIYQKKVDCWSFISPVITLV